MSDPRIALVELVSNSYDAGARTVLLTWPPAGGEVRIQDDGHGMTPSQFDERWRTLSYKRSLKQGGSVEFPQGVSARPRNALGQHGKGRHGAFCFADRYVVETWRDGVLTAVTVTLVGSEEEPYHCDIKSDDQRDGHGTIIRIPSADLQLTEGDVRETIGSTFIVDPDLQVFVNGDLIELADLQSISTVPVEVPGYETVTVHQVIPDRRNRTTHLKGMTYWVRGKRVGAPSWKGLEDEGSLLDGRKTEAKSYAFIVIADQLYDQLKPDWTGFYAGKKTQAVTEAVRSHVNTTVRGLLHDARRERKKRAITENKWIVRQLPVESQNTVGEFIDRVLESCPSISAPRCFRWVA